MIPKRDDKRNENEINLILSIDVALHPSRLNDWYLVVVGLKWETLSKCSRFVHFSNSQLIIGKGQIFDKECTITLISPKPQRFFKEGFQQSESHHFILKEPFDSGEMYFTWFLPVKNASSDQEVKKYVVKRQGIEIEICIEGHKYLLGF